MARLSLHQLGERLRHERGSRGIREVAAEIGISAATLSRVERGNVPDLETFAKICRWLGVDPGDVLGIEVPKGARRGTREGRVVATAHFRAGQTTSPQLAKALAEMILAAQDMLASESR
jgi:transcriptional regulator with XRE-family HTH domain